jgi:splicing factor 3B subunit 4
MTVLRYLFQGNLDERCTDALVWELMLQAGPVGELKLNLCRACSLTWPFCSFSVNVHLPKDRISMAHQGYGFCEFLTEEDAEYACKIMNQIKLWGKPIRVNKVRGSLNFFFKIFFADDVFSNLYHWRLYHLCLSAILLLKRIWLLFSFFVQASSDKKQLDVGANLFIGNLDENVDERLLYDTFSAFGVMATTAKVCNSSHLMLPILIVI